MLQLFENGFAYNDNNIGPNCDCFLWKSRTIPNNIVSNTKQKGMSSPVDIGSRKFVNVGHKDATIEYLQEVSQPTVEHSHLISFLANSIFSINF